MALAFSVQLYFPPLKGIRQRIVLVTLDAAYPAGGWAITAANVKLTRITQIFPMNTVGGYVFEFDDGASKLKAFWGDNNNASDGVLIEIPTNDAGISTLVVPCHVIGS